jgi:putative ABC transport system substrate-binding protein
VVTLVTLGILCASLAAAAPPRTKVYRIGWLSSGFPPPEPYPPLEAFRQGLREFGYIEGQNLVVEYRYAEGSQERLRDLAAELVRLPVAVLVTGGLDAARAAQETTNTTPIVLLGGGDPVRQGVISSLAHPRGNITGVTAMRQDLNTKRLEILKEAVPHIARIAVLTNPAAPAHAADLQDLVVASRIAALAARHQLPAMYPWKMFVEAGGLMAYAPSLLDMYRRAAYYMDKILKGAKPADLPVEQPTKFELVINLKTAQALGLTIPPAVLFQADEVIR